MIVFLPVMINNTYAQEENMEIFAEKSISDSLYTIKSPKGAMYRSLAFPGWGQWYNEKKLKSLLVFSAETGFITGIITQHYRLSKADTPADRTFYRDDRNKFVWWLGGAILYSMLDAFVDAYLDDFHGEMDINRDQKNDLVFKVDYKIDMSRFFQRRK
ncbi:DUF5683 domain-containing protein [candidate division KSB1 bacterium]